MLAVIAEDLAAHIDRSHHRGLRFWLRVVAKAAFSPAAHATVIYRISHACYHVLPLRPLAFLLRSLSVVWSGAEIHPSAKIGPGFCIVHSQMMVIGNGVTIGKNCRVHHGVAISADQGRGSDPARAGFPVIGDGVAIGLHAIVMGPVHVGDNAVISAQSMVVKDVPADTAVAGSPARVVKKLDDVPPLLG